MTLHPQHLHSLAALHSLTAAWPHLERAQRGVQLADAMSGDRGTLRSPTYGSRGAGGVANPVLSAIEGASHTASSSTERVARSAAGTVLWLAQLLAVVRPTEPAMLSALRGRVPAMHPDTAVHLGLHIAEADGKIREHLGLGDDHQLLRGRACPRCGTRRLALRTSAPPQQRVVVCEAGCLCAGDDCPCGMGVRVAEVAHIWTPDQLGQPTTTRGAA